MSAAAELLTSGLLGKSGAGSFRVTIGPRWWDRLLARRYGHARGGNIAVSLCVTDTLTGQHWVRTIGDRRIVSTLTGVGDRLVEQFGRIRLTFRPTADVDEARLELEGIALDLGRATISVPPWMARFVPQVACRTLRTDDGLHVMVNVRTWRGRSVLTYSGVIA